MMDVDRSFMCIECGEVRVVDEAGHEQQGARAGWRMVETHVDTADDHVRVTISEILTGRIVYSARYSPETARQLAQKLTLASYSLEDG